MMRVDVEFDYEEAPSLNRVVRGASLLQPVITLKRDIAGASTREFQLPTNRALLLLFVHRAFAQQRIRAFDSQDNILLEFDLIKDEEVLIPLPSTATKLAVGNDDPAPAPIELALL